MQTRLVFPGTHQGPAFSWFTSLQTLGCSFDSSNKRELIVPVVSVTLLATAWKKGVPSHFKSPSEALHNTFILILKIITWSTSYFTGSWKCFLLKSRQCANWNVEFSEFQRGNIEWLLETNKYPCYRCHEVDSSLQICHWTGMHWIAIQSNS